MDPFTLSAAVAVALVAGGIYWAGTGNQIGQRKIAREALRLALDGVDKPRETARDIGPADFPYWAGDRK